MPCNFRRQVIEGSVIRLQGDVVGIRQNTTVVEKDLGDSKKTVKLMAKFYKKFKFQLASYSRLFCGFSGKKRNCHHGVRLI